MENSTKCYEEISPAPHNLLQKIDKEIFLNAFYEASIILISKLDIDVLRKENYLVFPINIEVKILNKTLAVWI